ncbi:MAG: hypothetical protein GKR89_05685 [Candidatus Latescibacteria bacterium]|nr:hypothetical protein [Candidatus Latescibacterota bacterium]
MRLALLPILLLAVLWSPPQTPADQVRIASPSEWARWDLPGDAVEIDPLGVRPRFVRRDIDAVANAPDFGGGIRLVGTDAANALRLIDGDASTFWTPDEDDDLDTWFIEVNLGRAVSARTLRLHFDPQSPPLEFFKILTSDGEPFFNNANSVIPGTLRYNKRQRYSFNESHLIEIDFGLKPLQYIRIEADLKTAGARLSELAVESVGDNLSLRIKERGGNVGIISEIGSKTRELVESTGISGTLTDGDINTYWGTVHRGGSGVQAEQQFGQFEIDLGALFWVDRVRLLGDGSGVAPGKGSGRHRGGVFNYLWYQMSGSDGSLAPDGSLRWEMLGELPSSRDNLQGIVHFEERFPLRKMRHVRLFFPMSDGFQAFNGRIGTTAEIQVFGEGYPAEAVMRSPLFDLGRNMNLSALSWIADLPAATRIELRSRTGNLLAEEYAFYDKNGKEVTQKKWDRLIPSFRGPVDTVRTAGSDWSPWSRTYRQSGQVFLSPTPRRYAQLEARFFSDDPHQAATLNEVALEFGTPLASRTQGEIHPTQVPPGQASLFTYFLRSTLSSSDGGFDRLELVSSAGVDFRQMRVDGVVVSARLEILEDGIAVQLDTPVRRTSLVEIDFESTLFLNQTRFDAFLFNTGQDGQVRQRVDPGDATDQIDSQVNFVSLPNSGRLIGAMALSSPVFTPNGDGINDRLQLTFDLLKVLVPRPLDVSLHDLAGRLIRRLSTDRTTAGHIVLEWDGLDHNSGQVPPGLYMLRIEVEGDDHTDSHSRLVGVAY